MDQIRLRMHPEVYEPAEDSFMLAENIDAKPNEVVLDVGTGCGIQAIIAAKTAKHVIGVDINPAAIELAKLNAELNDVKNIEFCISDLFANVTRQFNLIIFNPPYVPSNEKDILGRAWAGGKNGRDIIDRFLSEVSAHLTENGRFLLLVSSLNNIKDLEKGFKKRGFSFEIVARQKFFFEELYVVKGSLVA